MKAKVRTVAVEIECPKCLGPIAAPNGSLFWQVTELPPANVGVRCFGCNAGFTLPKHLA